MTLTMIPTALACLATGAALFGVTHPRWKGARSTYFTRPVTISVLVTLGVCGGWLLTSERPTLGWMSLVVAAWIVLEIAFAAWRNTTDAQAPTATAEAAAGPRRANPTPHGPRRRRRRR